MDRNTFRTLLGFYATKLRQWTGISLRANRPDAVYNYRAISDRLHTSGQPSAAQFAAIRDAGFHRVINLAPAGVENALPDEAATLAVLGMEYVHIPVDFRRPSDEDFARFVAAYEDGGDDKVWVHCAANARVSAFVYRYRRDVLNEDERTARADLNAIWEPMGVWRKFLNWPEEDKS